jgi:hypothetical protein
LLATHDDEEAEHKFLRKTSLIPTNHRSLIKISEKVQDSVFKDNMPIIYPKMQVLVSRAKTRNSRSSFALLLAFHHMMHHLAATLEDPCER